MNKAKMPVFKKLFNLSSFKEAAYDIKKATLTVMERMADKPEEKATLGVVSSIVGTIFLLNGADNLKIEFLLAGALLLAYGAKNIKERQKGGKLDIFLKNLGSKLQDTNER